MAALLEVLLNSNATWPKRARGGANGKGAGLKSAEKVVI